MLQQHGSRGQTGFDRRLDSAIDPRGSWDFWSSDPCGFLRAAVRDGSRFDPELYPSRSWRKPLNVAVSFTASL
jgi:hypothetical protein